jgi:membrane-associated phospholipid phosphatase
MIKLFTYKNFYFFIIYLFLTLSIIFLFNSPKDSPYKSPKDFQERKNLKSISIIKNLGDINQFTPHIITLSILLLKKDIPGIYLYSKIIATSLVSTYIIKYSVNRIRPNQSQHSFPSGHSSFTIISFIFLLFRFNFLYSIIPFICTLFVGYSRVISNYHYISDILAGYLLSLIISHIFFYLTKNNYIITKQLRIKEVLFHIFYLILFNLLYLLYLIY